ncbi:hypothetical protein ACSA9R_000524 [Escherichia coli]|jgi:hypothetical protein|uniref:hypothetical protein n=1 Tax=Escherichia coli TaxID=562 RepID=UPI000B16B12D|nr:hypothetical protein [Escherichia coli]EEV9969640.1 DUF551 domain-containing protein [Escherichia coli]EFB1875157.1 DUF551 domain-containing protein [Escherichia coli]EFB3371803.1 DUF551 domain-containing protein [Escherichia coli]EFB6237522.1 DUF551 domain-containing protein [Escherichia coli]EFB9514364.1 DUF551 domain-containing protein [Escherichia coli]
MTTITRKEQKQVLIDTANHVINRDNTSPYSENLRELARIALASLEAEPISQTYNLPQTHFEQVADLYEMQFEDGRTCTFHTDAQKAVQWLQACDGNRVQEYVKLERLQNALSGNSPVTPDGWVMVPKELTPEMMRAVQIRSELGGYATSNLSGAYNMFSEFWNVAVSAAPKVDDL